MTTTLALGVRLLLIHAIHQHRRADMKAGRNPRMPRRFDLHPEHFCALEVDAQPNEAMSLWQWPPHFWTVEIKVDPRVDFARMVTADNAVEIL